MDICSIIVKPNFFCSSFFRTFFHFKKKNYAEARKELERAVSLLQEPDSEVLDHLGQALWHLGQKPEAVAALEKAAGLPEADGAVKKRLEEYRAGQPPQP